MIVKIVNVQQKRLEDNNRRDKYTTPCLIVRIKSKSSHANRHFCRNCNHNLRQKYRLVKTIFKLFAKILHFVEVLNQVDIRERSVRKSILIRTVNRKSQV